MKEYKNLLSKAKYLVDQAARERAAVREEGRSKDWEQKQYNAIQAKYTQQAQDLSNQMFRVALQGAIDAKQAADRKRKRPSGPLNQVDGSEKLYHLQRAELLLGGQNEEAAISEYGYIASTLDDKEKPFKYIYEDVLSAKVQDPVNKIRAQEEILKYKPAEERELIKEAEEAWRIKELNQAITNHLLHDIEKVTTGQGDPPTYEYSEFIEGQTQQELNQQRSIEAEAGIRQAMKDNPHMDEEQ